MHIIDALPDYIPLGHLNEKCVSEIQFDVTAWLTLYLTGLLNITYTRPGEAAVYPVDDTGVSLAAPTHGNLALSTVDDVNILTWTVSNAVTYIAGTGTVVIGLTVGADKDKRSNKAMTIVDEGHATAGTPPEPLASYLAKWGSVDATVEGIAVGEEASVVVTQDANGTHFAFTLPYIPLPN